MADFDGLISPSPDWADVPSLAKEAVALGGSNGAGAMNAQAVALTKRTNYLINYSIQISPVTGRAGLATSSPLGRFQIGDATVNPDNKIVLGKAQASSESNLPAIGHTSNGVGNDLSLASTSASGSVKIFTGASTNSAEIGTGSNSEKFRVESSGYVTANGPAARIAVSPATATNNAFAQFTNTGGIGYVGLDNAAGALTGSVYGLGVWHSGNYHIRFGTNNILRAYFSQDGIFNKIVSSSNGSETVGIRFTDGTSNLGSIRSFSNGSNNQQVRVYSSNAGSETIAASFIENGDTRIHNRLGISDAPSTAWASAYSTIQLKTHSSIYSNGAAITGIGSNYYVNGSNASIFTKADYATAYEQQSGTHNWFRSSAVGAIGGTASWIKSMSISASGNVCVGSDVATQKFDVVDSADTAAIIRTTGTTNSAFLSLSSGNGTTSGRYSYLNFVNNDTNAQSWRVGTYGDNTFVVRDHKAGSIRFRVDTSGWTGFYMGGSTVFVGSGLLTNGTTNDSTIRWDATGSLRISKSTTTVAQFNASGDLEMMTTGSIKVPSGTTAQRPATPQEGMIRKNDTTKVVEAYSGGGWTYLQGGFVKRSEFTTSGTFIPDPATRCFVYEIYGAGGGGGAAAPTAANEHSCGDPGQHGNAIIGFVPRTTAISGVSYTVTIGAGGTAGTQSANGGNGGSTSITSTTGPSSITVNGGNGGTTRGVTPLATTIVRNSVFLGADNSDAGSGHFANTVWSRPKSQQFNALITPENGYVWVNLRPSNIENAGSGGLPGSNYPSSASWNNGDPGGSGKVVIYEYS